MSFSGFTEEEITKLKSGNLNCQPGNLTNQSANTSSRRYVKPRRRRSDNYILTSQTNNINDTRNEIPEGAKLKTEVKNDLNPKVLDETECLNLSEKATKENINPEVTSSSNSITLTTTKIEKKVIDLNEFQARQKYIEEQNRRRKEVLSKALADRTKQTEEEARKLKEIKHEFKKLDELLSSDVAILRQQIETASMEFMEAQKRYDKAEKEYLDAKLILHHKLEKKELLTEHLCTIIGKNEERKAEKLNELMNRLDVSDKAINQPETSSENILKNENAGAQGTENDKVTEATLPDVRSGKQNEAPAATNEYK